VYAVFPRLPAVNAAAHDLLQNILEQIMFCAHSPFQLLNQDLIARSSPGRESCKLA
jgi:hypothetical protein